MMSRNVLCCSVLLLLAGLAPAAESAPVPFRELYRQLSDSEFASLKPGPVAVPLLAPEWERGPLPGSLFDLGAPSFAADREIANQARVLGGFRDPRILARTANELGLCANPKAVPPLLALAAKADNDPRLQAELLLALAHQRTPAAALAAKALEAPEPLLRQAAATLYAVQADAKPGVLLAAAQRETQAAVRHALYAAAATLPPTARDWEPLLAGSDPEDLAWAVRSTLAAGAASARDSLLKLTEHPAAGVRFALAEGLRDSSDRTLAAELLARLAQDANPGVRAAAAQTLGRLPAAAVFQPTVKKLATDRDLAVRTRLAESLGAYRGEATLVLLLQLAADPASDPLRQTARRALARIAADPAAGSDTPALLGRCLADPDAYRRLAACEALAAAGSRRFGPELAALLAREKAVPNRVAVLHALVVAGHDPGPQLGLADAKHQALALRAAVAEAIGAFRWREGLPILAQIATKDHDPEPRRQAFLAMGRLADASFAAPCLEVLKRTNYAANEFLAAEDRAAACWVVARLPALDPALLDRLVTLVRKPVVSVPQSPPAYDAQIVRASAILALIGAGQRLKNPKCLALGRELAIAYGSDLSKGGTVEAPPCDEVAVAQAEQLKSLLDGRTPAPAVLTASSREFTQRAPRAEP